MTHPVRFTAAITREGQWYVARCLEVEVASQGESLDQTLDNLREALEPVFRTLLLLLSIDKIRDLYGALPWQRSDSSPTWHGCSSSLGEP